MIPCNAPYYIGTTLHGLCALPKGHTARYHRTADTANIPVSWVGASIPEPLYPVCTVCGIADDHSNGWCLITASDNDPEESLPHAQARTLSDALNGYRDAVAQRAYWEHNGTRRDGNLHRALSAEATARKAVFTAAAALGGI